MREIKIQNVDILICIIYISSFIPGYSFFKDKIYNVLYKYCVKPTNEEISYISQYMKDVSRIMTYERVEKKLNTWFDMMENKDKNSEDKNEKRI